MTSTLILQEDDCAPDAREHFLELFHTLIGVSFEDWRKLAEKTSDDIQDYIEYELDGITAYQDAYDQVWKIYGEL